MKNQRKNVISPLYYIYGEEDYLVEKNLEDIKSKAVTKGFESMNYHVYGGKGIDPYEIISTAMTLPAFSEKRLVVVKDMDTVPAAKEKVFEEYVKNPSPSTCLVFTASTWKINKSSAIFKSITKAGCVKVHYLLKENALISWIKKKAAEDGKTISDHVARQLTQVAGSRLRDVCGELEKIILFVGNSTVIEAKDVEASSIDVKEETIFALSDAMGKKDVKEAYRILGKLSGEAPVMVLGAVIRQFRILFKIKSALANGTSAAKLSSLLKLQPRHMEGYLARSRRFTEGELGEALRKLLTADTCLKTGRLPRTLVLPGLIVDLCMGRSV